MSFKRRLAAATVAGSLLVFAFAGATSANLVSKTINTDASGAALLQTDPATGQTFFSGTLTFSADEAGHTVRVVDFICGHTPGGMQFMSVGGTYRLDISGAEVPGDPGSIPTATDSYVIPDGFDCASSTSPISTAEGAEFVVPSNDLSVNYQVSRTSDQFTQEDFANFNSVRNDAYSFDVTSGQSSVARSLSVLPPGPPVIIPEAPLAILLVLTSGLLVVWFVSRRMRSASVPAAA
jgi:hypothetical protein